MKFICLIFTIGFALFADGVSAVVTSRPEIFSVEPNQGSLAGGLEITIKGMFNFNKYDLKVVVQNNKIGLQLCLYRKWIC